MNPESQKEYMRLRNIEKFEAYTAWLSYVKASPCADCGGSFPPCAMDFDHVRGKKLGKISGGQSWAKKKVFEEMSKCDIVCSNCHRIRTHLMGRPLAITGLQGVNH